MKIFHRFWLLWFIAGSLLAGCTLDKSMQWQTPLYRDHPLTGKIWIPAEGRFAVPAELYAAAAKTDFLLIGEKHDNADHHLLQARLLAEIGRAARGGTVVFEMLTQSQQQKLDDHLAAEPGDAEGIGPAVGWDDSGWPDWSIYEPIFRQALDNGMHLAAGSMNKATIKEIARQGLQALGEDQISELMLDQPLSEATRDQMRKVIFRSHCEQLPEHMLDPMVSVTLAKDALMAETLKRSRDGGGQAPAVLIAGGGHVRKDWGVPMHLSRLSPGARTVAVGLVEVEKGAVDPVEYLSGPADEGRFDFVWFTPRVTDEDPCEAFAEQLRQIREKSESQEDSSAD